MHVELASEEGSSVAQVQVDCDIDLAQLVANLYYTPVRMSIEVILYVNISDTLTVKSHVIQS